MFKNKVILSYTLILALILQLPLLFGEKLNSNVKEKDNIKSDSANVENDKSESNTLERFNEFKDLLLKSAPDNKKEELKIELEKLSKNKDFLSQLTPEKINQIKNEIDIYKNDKDGGVDEKITEQLTLDLKNKKELESVKDNDKKNITFDFPNVSLAEFTRFIANLNEKILIGDNLLQGDVTLKTPEKISLKELMDVFTALLNSNGLSYMISGDYLQIFQKSDSEVKVYKINYLKSKDVAKTLKDIFKMSFRVGGVPEKVMIDSLDQANSIIVLAPKEKHTEIAQAVKEIDFRRRQVLMEVRVLELTHTDNFGFGGTFAFDYGATGGGMAPGVTSYDGDPIPPNFSDITNPYSGVLYNNGQFMYDLEADKRISKIKILSQPRILTSENQKAEIKVGEQQPVINAVTNMGVSSENAPIEQTTVDWKEVGVDLTITPRINSKRDVTLELDMKITSILRLVTVGSWENYPVIGQRIAKNTSTVKDNEMLIIGGLLKDEKVTTRTQVPFFGEIPMMGWMFATYEDKIEQTELVILVIPRVIETPEDGKIVTEREKAFLENYNKKNKEEIDRMIEGERDKSWDLFNVYNYFNDEEYQKEQMFIPQEWGEK